MCYIGIYHHQTVSFVAYILRSIGESIKQYQDDIADAVIMLLKDCPPEASTTRKELLVASRHIWYTEFRAPFLKYLDQLLNEEILLGTGLTCRESVRPLGHSVLVDLIHHVRLDLNPSLLVRTVSVYSKNLHDPSFAPNIHTMCVKLLINLVEVIMRMKEVDQAKKFMTEILRSLTFKLRWLHEVFPGFVNAAHRKPQELTTEDINLSLDYYLDVGREQPIHTTSKAFEQSQDLPKGYFIL
jgi:transformation/transcription domain-associated protein